MNNIVSINHGRKHFQTQHGVRQVQRNAPLKPTREQILDLFLDHCPIPTIAVNTGTSGAVVLAVIAAYMEQYMRQSIAGKIDAAPCVLERYKVIERECWEDFAISKVAA